MSKKICLLYKQPQNNKLISILLLIIITISILLTYKYKAYNVLNIIGIIKCEKTCYIDTSIPYENISIIDKKTILSYKDKKYKIEKIDYSEPYLNNNIPYQDIKIYTSLKTDEKIIKVKLLYNKQRIIKKILEKIIKEE